MKPTVRHRTAMLSLVAAASVYVFAVWVGLAVASQDRDEAEEQELVSLSSIVGAALLGQIIPAEEPFGWANDYWKGTEQTTFVPFTLTVEQSKLSTPTVAMFVVAARQGAAAADSTAVSPGRTEASTLPPLAFEDAFHLALGAPTADGVYEIRRAFWVPGGDYVVYVALSESGVPDGTEAKTMMLKRAVTVPNLWSDQLTTSSVIQAARIESLGAPPPANQQLANPYTLGTMRIVPKRIPEYLKSEEISLVFLVYNAGVTASGLPDVHVEYTFNTLGSDGDEYFNRTNPQDFNEQTLPPGFDLAAGHQLVAGQAVPLSGFPEADYRLEIKVTDNTNGASLIRHVDFSVSAS